jgi:hypothetical protein
MGQEQWLLDNILWVSIGSLALLAAAHFAIVYAFKASGKKSDKPHEPT